MRITVLTLLFFALRFSVAGAQTDSAAASPKAITPARVIPKQKYVPLDSVEIDPGREQFKADSIARFYLAPDSLREDQYISRVYKDNLTALISFPQARGNTAVFRQSGQPRKSRDLWVISVIICLLLYTAFINIFLNKDLSSVMRSFYSKNALSQADKEGGLINSWSLIALFLLFSLAFGLVLYQLTIYEDIRYRFSGFRLFLTFSLGVAALFMLKYVVLKFLGFVFGVKGLVSQYVAILNLTYFNAAFVLLAAAICFSLLARIFVPVLLTATVVMVAIIFAWQYLRNSVNVISNIRFHKIYLFIYLCALEICPVLILIKALNI